MTVGAAATRVVVSYSPAEDRIGDALDTDAYRSYLRRAHEGTVATGAEWTEFVGRGCGVTSDVTLRVEAVMDGDVIDEETAFEFEPRSG